MGLSSFLSFFLNCFYCRRVARTRCPHFTHSCASARSYYGSSPRCTRFSTSCASKHPRASWPGPRQTRGAHLSFREVFFHSRWKRTSERTGARHRFSRAPAEVHRAEGSGCAHKAGGDAADTVQQAFPRQIASEFYKRSEESTSPHRSFPQTTRREERILSLTFRWTNHALLAAGNSERTGDVRHHFRTTFWPDSVHLPPYKALR